MKHECKISNSYPIAQEKDAFVYTKQEIMLALVSF